MNYFTITGSFWITEEHLDQAKELAFDISEMPGMKVDIDFNFDDFTCPMAVMDVLISADTDDEVIDYPCVRVFQEFISRIWKLHGTQYGSYGCEMAIFLSYDISTGPIFRHIPFKMDGSKPVWLVIPE